MSGLKVTGSGLLVPEGAVVEERYPERPTGAQREAIQAGVQAMRQRGGYVFGPDWREFKADHGYVIPLQGRRYHADTFDWTHLTFFAAGARRALDHPKTVLAVELDGGQVAVDILLWVGRAQLAREMARWAGQAEVFSILEGRQIPVEQLVERVPWKDLD